MVKKIKILAIAPYPGMSELLTQISQTRQDAEITVRLGNLNDGLDIAKNLLQHNSYDVILSRGGTAELLKKSLSAFVVEIPLSVYDILRCIKMAQNYGGKFAIAGFSGITSNAKILCDLLQIDTKIVTFFDEKEGIRLFSCNLRPDWADDRANHWYEFYIHPFRNRKYQSGH